MTVGAAIGRPKWDALRRERYVCMQRKPQVHLLHSVGAAIGRPPFLHGTPIRTPAPTKGGKIVCTQRFGFRIFTVRQ